MYAKIKKLLQETAESDDIAKISDLATPKNDPAQNIMHGEPTEPLPESRLNKILKNLKENEITTIKSTFLGKPTKKPASPTSPTPHNMPADTTKPKKKKNTTLAPFLG